MKNRFIVAIIAGACVLATAHVASAAPAARRWVRETGNGYGQAALGVAVDDGGDAFVVGSTKGKFPLSGDPVSHDATTAFLAQYNRRGGLVWSTQFGTASTTATAVARDGDGNLDVVGITAGPGHFPGSPDDNAGMEDAFVRQYDGAGGHQWTHLLGTTADDRALAVAADAEGAVFVGGETLGTMPGAPETAAGIWDGWIAKYGATGTLEWAHQLGTGASDGIKGITASVGGGADVIGYTEGALAGPGSHKGDRDLFVAHYDDDGTRTWLRQLGTASYEEASAIAEDAQGHVFVTGDTGGALPGWAGEADPTQDVYVVELDGAGNRIDTFQFGSSTSEEGYGVAVDDLGDVFVTGFTFGKMKGASESPQGQQDAFVARVAPATHRAGRRVAWVHQLGTPNSDEGNAIAATSAGAVTAVGFATGTLPGAPKSHGGTDVFVARFSRVS